jgi:phage terminase Nu1 subunit (DNA packaging protein)
LTTAKAEIAEMNLAEQRGELHRAVAVMSVWADNVMNAKTRLLAIPTKISPELVGKDAPEITHKLKEEINEALNELAEYDERRITSAAASLRK